VSRPALLVLADGTVFDGVAVGVDGIAAGEVVFNTSMTGYQEILTDPSYARQIVTLTMPHIGNTGANPQDIESTGVFATGLVVRDLPLRHSNFRANTSLGEWLQARDVVAISDVDTRALTRHLRESGAQGGCIIAGFTAGREAALDEALAAAKAFPGLSGMDLAREVSCRESYVWKAGPWRLVTDTTAQDQAQAQAQAQAMDDDDSGRCLHVVAMDFGIKQNILRLLVERGCRVTVVPAITDADAIRAYSPDGLFLSNGPGDPEPCDYAIKTIRTLLEEDRLPTFGICLGHQLLALASGARTTKMKFGHHGANHPVLDITTGRVMISSQNHGFAVDADTLGNDIAITHTSLFDGTLQGIRRLDVPAFGFQGHPEASPGPHDVVALFDRFVESMQD